MGATPGNGSRPGGDADSAFGRRCAWLATLAASLLLGASAQAQTHACELLKRTLAERIEATGVRGYSLEAVPARTPVPRDAKVIGTCEGGAVKVLYRRWGAARAAASAVSEGASTPAAQAVVAAPPASSVRRDAPLRPVPASAPSTRREPVIAPARGAASVPVAKSAAAASAVVAPASDVQPVRTMDVAVERPTPVAVDKPVEVKAASTRSAWDFMTPRWRWIAVLLLLPLVGWLWAWRAHRNAYDEAGLPRGPKL